MAEKTKGKCKYCGKEYTKAYMLRHLKTCKKRTERLAGESKSPFEGYFELEITGKYDDDHWLIIEMNENETLRKLDKFLRDIWLECCGHLSAFKINKIRYEAYPEETYGLGVPSRSINIKLKKVLSVDQTLDYEYDFGSTTHLVIKVKNYRTGGRKKEKLTVLSRNNPLEYVCQICGKAPAEYICPEWHHFGRNSGFLCRDCTGKHEELDFGILPVCNSPRIGVCGYCGSEIYPDSFEPDV